MVVHTLDDTLFVSAVKCLGNRRADLRLAISCAEGILEEEEIMKRMALIAATFGALATALSVSPANAFPAANATTFSPDAANMIETVRYEDGYSNYNRGYNRGHRRGIRFFFGGRRHGGEYAYGGHRRNYGWGYGRRGDRGGHDQGNGGRYGRGH